ncbi:MAG TPA: protein kinase [Gemmatimonadales bacterium]|nr:protein kinase [Gemmatimonadales bacterium]
MDDTRTRLTTALAGRYTIEREVGSGGMATVYSALDLRHHRRVAVKVLRPELAAALGPVRFLREIEIAAQLSHPHILPLHDSGEADGLLFFVMPFVEGESLRDRIRRDGPLSIPDAVRVLRDVADALAYAHDHGVVHRDIKPDNVMLAGRHAAVTDFGIAKALTDAAGSTQVTTVGISIGTPAYMAPEQCAAEPTVDHRADIYSLGVLAYEMLTGRTPFTGSSAQAILAAHLVDQPPPLQQVREDVPGPLAELVMRCLEKKPSDRWQSAGDLLARLEAPAISGEMPAASSPRRRWRTLAIVGVAAILAGAWIVSTQWRGVRVRYAREQLLPRIQRLADSGAAEAAYRLAREASTIIPEDPALQRVWSRVAVAVSIRTEPPGAAVYRRDYAARDTTWQPLGVTPLDSIWFPIGFSRIKVEKSGFHAFLGALDPQWAPTRPIRLESDSTAHLGMVRVLGADRVDLHFPGLDHLAPVPLADYFIDRTEVTNRQFKVFVDSGGYRRPELWQEPFEENGRRLSWDQAMARFKDKTGRPGPATWEVGDYPSGQGELPVTGVSWYEAAAYAKFVGRALPTIFHWSRAAETRDANWIVPASNLEGHGLAPAGAFRGLGPYGTLDMAGNAREWCLNETRGQRYILGGGWNDPTYQFTEAFAQPPFDRSATNGFRLALYSPDDSTVRAASEPIAWPTRDFATERPVSDAVFAIYRRAYDYDRTPLQEKVEGTDSSAEDWVVQRVSFAAAYGDERMMAYLFLPKRGRPPYQTLVYFPGAIAMVSRSLEVEAIDFILKSGRAVLYPVYKSTYERADNLKSWYANESNAYREHVVMWGKDFRRSIDYLETRSDIDTTRLAYYGRSWGGYLGGILPALEPRLKTAVLYVAGLQIQRGQPEVEPINFLPRITIPVLMLNGRYDHFFPVQTSQDPMFRLLGTPAARKRHVLYDGGHFVPRTTLFSEVLEWLDRYLGPVGR